VLTDRTIRDVAQEMAGEIAALPTTTDCVAALEQL
jgi:hypothetical protein